MSFQFPVSMNGFSESLDEKRLDLDAPLLSDSLFLSFEAQLLGLSH